MITSPIEPIKKGKTDCPSICLCRKNNALRSQQGSSLILVLFISLVVGLVATIVLMDDKVESTQNRMHKNQILAKNAAEAGYNWVISMYEGDLPSPFATHGSDGSTQETDGCKSYPNSALSSFEGSSVIRENGWMVRRSTGSNTLSGAQNEEVKIKVWHPDKHTMNTIVRAVINGKDSVELSYVGRLVSVADFAFFGQGDMDLGFRWGREYSGNVHINGNAYIGALEAPTGEVYINNSKISATGTIHRYKNSYWDLAQDKANYINSHKLSFFVDPVMAPLMYANFDFLTVPTGKVFINGIEMVLNGPTNSDDSDNSSWPSIKTKFKGALEDHAPPVKFDLIEITTTHPCNGKGVFAYYQPVTDFITAGYMPLDSIFNSSYGHYTGGNTSYRLSSNKTNDLEKHATYVFNKCKKGTKGLVNAFYKTDSWCVSADINFNWFGGPEGGQWVVARIIDLSDPRFYPGKNFGTYLDGLDYNLIIRNASLLKYPITIKTDGEIYMMGDFNVGHQHNDPNLLEFGKFIGKIDDPDPAANIDTTKIVDAAVIANKNRIWYLSYDWDESSYGHVPSGSRGMTPRDQRKAGKRPDDIRHNNATYVGLFVTGDPKNGEAFWLTGKSQGGVFGQTPNTLEHETVGVSDTSSHNVAFRFYGSIAYLQNGMVDTSGAYGDGANLFSAPFAGRLKNGDRSISYNGKIPPKYARSWHTYTMTFSEFPIEPPGVRKQYELVGIKIKTVF